MKLSVFWLFFKTDESIVKIYQISEDAENKIQILKTSIYTFRSHIRELLQCPLLKYSRFDLWFELFMIEKILGWVLANMAVKLILSKHLNIQIYLDSKSKFYLRIG